MANNVLITGGTRGIGLGIAQELSKYGYNLAINGMRNQEKVIHIIQGLTKFGSEVIYCQGDISTKLDRERIVNKAIERFGEIHVLVNNAGIAPKKRVDILETNMDSFNDVMDTNLKAPFFITQKIARHMIKNSSSLSAKNRCIINISSISATMASINRSEYCLSKAGLSMMTKLFATKLGEYGIPVFEIQPGIIKTDMTYDVLKKYEKLVDNNLTIQPRLGMPEDVGKVVKALLEGNFAYSSGQVIMVDGGLLVPRL